MTRLSNPNTVLRRPCTSNRTQYSEITVQCQDAHYYSPVGNLNCDPAVLYAYIKSVRAGVASSSSSRRLIVVHTL